MDAKAALYLPKDDKGSLPLLQPPRTLASISYYLDLKAFWENRAKLLNKTQLKPLEDFDANSGRFLGGHQAQHAVSAIGASSADRRRPAAEVPVQDQAGNADPGLRPGAGNPRPGLRQVDEHASCGPAGSSPASSSTCAWPRKSTATTPWSPTTSTKTSPSRAIPATFALNYSPAFVVVGNQLVVSSTAELAHDLVDELVKESKTPKTTPATTQIALFAKGGAEAAASHAGAAPGPGDSQPGPAAGRRP